MIRIHLVILAALLSTVAAQNSCVGRCEKGVDPEASCQCNPSCGEFNDCCEDYIEVCMTCKDRCGPGHDNGRECQCNTSCSQYDDCCPDYEELCNEGGE